MALYSVTGRAEEDILLGRERYHIIERHLEALYTRYHHRKYVHPDPLEFLYHYDEPLDREIAAMVASALAFGRVTQILKSVRGVLERMGKPRRYLDEAARSTLQYSFTGFKHRFVTERELVEFLYAIKVIVEQRGSLENAFGDGCRASDETVLPALQGFIDLLRTACKTKRNYLLPVPERGSACKRLHLFLRWMVRCDDVDPGGWQGISSRKLICPVDTHMHRIGLALGFTRRKQANARCALEITQALRRIDAQDPVRFDFALTRLGIRRDGDPEAFLRACRAESIAPPAC